MSYPVGLDIHFLFSSFRGTVLTHRGKTFVLSRPSDSTYAVSTSLRSSEYPSGYSSFTPLRSSHFTRPSWSIKDHSVLRYVQLGPPVSVPPSHYRSMSSLRLSGIRHQIGDKERSDESPLRRMAPTPLLEGSPLPQESTGQLKFSPD